MLFFGADVVSHALLQPLGLYFQTRLRCFCCSNCNALLLPHTAIGHVRDHIRSTEPKMEIRISDKDFRTACNELDPAASFPDPAQLNGISPLGSLTLYKNALLCRIPGCRRVYSTVASMETHCRETHGSEKRHNAWPMVYAQRLNHNTHNILFRIKPPAEFHANVDPEGWLARLEETVQQAVKPVSLTSHDPRDRTPWLSVTKWLEHVGSHEPEFLRSLVAMPKKDEFPLLAKAVDHIMNTAMQLIPLTPDLILQKINSGNPDKE